MFDRVRFDVISGVCCGCGVCYSMEASYDLLQEFYPSLSCERILCVTVDVSETMGVSLVSMATFEVVQYPFVVVLGRGCH